MSSGQTGISAEEARKALDWLVAMGADEIISETPVDRFAQSAKPSAATQPAPPPQKPAAVAAKPAVAAAKPASVAACASIAELEQALQALEDCALKRTASTLCFSGGMADAHVMVIGDVAGSEEDREGAVFAGQTLALLTRMLAAIGLSPAAGEPQSAVSLLNLVPWRPPGNRPPTPQEVEQLVPFTVRAVEILRPRAILCFGGLPAQALLGRTDSLMTMRGKWFELASGGRSIPLLSTFPPRMLLQQRAQKRLAWRDLLTLQDRLKELSA